MYLPQRNHLREMSVHDIPQFRRDELMEQKNINCCV